MIRRIAIPVIIAIIILVVLTSSKGRARIKNLVGFLPVNGKWSKRSLSGITDITLHHSATSPTTEIESIAQYHINTKGWPGIGYHYVIENTGQINQVNYLDDLSYHNGHNNSKAVGVCLIGNFETAYPTPAQIKSFLWLCRLLKKEIPSIENLVGHKEYANTTACPGQSVKMNELRAKTGLKIPSDIWASIGIRGRFAQGLQPEYFTSYNYSQADN